MVTTQNIPDLHQLTAADIAVKYPGAVEVMNKYRIDYCCGGKRNFAEACETTGANPEVIFHEIMEYPLQHPKEENILRFESWSPSLLVDFIIQNHHAYVRESVPQILELLDKVCEAHADNYPALSLIRDDFKKLADELDQHMKKEELILFPAIQRQTTGIPTAFDITAPIEVMEMEHESAGQLIKSIRILSNRHTAPSDACPTFLFTYKKLEEFDNDLMQHIHLENNILFEKVR
jgi:regulator of cell morphogenesis and NO signaling